MAPIELLSDCKLPCEYGKECQLRVYGEGTVLRSWAGKTHLVVPSASEAIARTDLPHY